MASGKAFIIVGINRGGTSAVTASLNALGIFLGSHSTPPVYEDRELSTAFRSRDWNKLKNIANGYALEHEIYAWKLPESRLKLKKLEKLLANAHFIFVFRDICAISMRKQKSLNEETIESMSSSMRSYQDIIKFAKKRHNDHLFLSYEKILTSPERYATSLLEFIGYEVSNTNIQKITDVISVSPAEYNIWADKVTQKKRIEEDNGLSGQLHKADSNSIFGWAKWLNTDTHVELTLLINNKEVSRFSANQFQQHLITSKFSKSGNRGFRIVTPAELEDGAEISVIESQTGVHLVGSPIKFSR